jgi:hypothetical protein
MIVIPCSPIPTSVPTVWNQSTQSGGLVFPDSLTVDGSGNSANASVITNNSHSTGKFYFETVLTTVNFKHGIGFASGAFGASQIGDDASPSLSQGAISAIGTWEGSGLGVSFTTAFNTVNDNFGIAIDLGNKLVWGRINGGSWAGGTGGGTPDPATGTNGLDVSNINGAVFCSGGPPYFIGISVFLDIVKAQFDSSSWSFSKPTGFSQW